MGQGEGLGKICRLPVSRRRRMLITVSERSWQTVRPGDGGWLILPIRRACAIDSEMLLYRAVNRWSTLANVGLSYFLVSWVEGRN